MTRRTFAATLAAVPALWARSRRIDITRFSAITDEIARSPAEAIEFCRKYGLKFVELRGVPGQRQTYEALTEEELKKAAQEFADAGLRVSFLDAGLYKYSMPGTEPVRRNPEAPEARERRLKRDGEQFERRMEFLSRALKAARILGTDQVRVFTFARVEKPEELMPRVAEVLAPMVELAAREKIRLLVENEASCNAATCAELAHIARLLPSKWFGINWDPDNGNAREKPWPDGYRILPRKRIHNVHLKGRTILNYPNKMDWGTIFRTMVDEGYKGKFGLETHIFGAEQVQRSHESMQEIHRILAAQG